MNECSVCREDFGGKVVPAILTCCGEEICYECGENYRVAKISNLTGNRKKIKCLLCNAEFHSINDTPWIVNKPMIKRLNLQVDLSCVREAQAARHLASSSRNYDAVSRRSQRTSNIDVEQNNNEERGYDRASDNDNSTGTSSAVAAGLKREASDQLSIEENNVETHTSNGAPSVGGGELAASRLKGEASDQLSIEREENVEAHESDEESRLSTVDEGVAARKRSKRSVTASESFFFRR